VGSDANTMREVRQVMLKAINNSEMCSFTATGHSIHGNIPRNTSITKLGCDSTTQDTIHYRGSSQISPVKNENLGNHLPAINVNFQKTMTTQNIKSPKNSLNVTQASINSNSLHKRSNSHILNNPI